MVLGQTKVKVSGEGAKREDSTRIRAWGMGSVLTVPRPHPSQTFMPGANLQSSLPRTCFPFSLWGFYTLKLDIED